jgi:hypothetical protein
MIADPLIDDEIMATGQGRKETFKRHFNSFIHQELAL